MEALAVIAGKRLPLENFKTSPSSVMEGKTTGGVSVLLAGKSIPFRHAFRHNPYSGEIQVLERKRGARPKVDWIIKKGKKKWIKGRFPLNRMYFVSVSQMADDDDVVDIAVRNAQGRFLSQFDHVVDRLLEGYV